MSKLIDTESQSDDVTKTNFLNLCDLQTMFQNRMMKMPTCLQFYLFIYLFILLQFGGEILVLLCFDDPIQILVILSRFQMFRTEAKLERFIWSHWSIKVAISH